MSKKSHHFRRKTITSPDSSDTGDIINQLSYSQISTTRHHWSTLKVWPFFSKDKNTDENTISGTMEKREDFFFIFIVLVQIINSLAPGIF